MSRGSKSATIAASGAERPLQPPTGTGTGRHTHLIRDPIARRSSTCFCLGQWGMFV